MKQTYSYLFLTVALLFVLACGVQAPIPPATDPAPATQTPSNVPDVSYTYDVVVFPS
jgi:predicted small lipoprotein YifL